MDRRAKLNLRQLIAERYGTYENLGTEIGVTKQAISNVVNGRPTSPTTRYAIAAALGCEVGEIDWPAALAA